MQHTEKDVVFSAFQGSGFIGYESGKYRLRSGSTSSLKSFIRKLSLANYSTSFETVGELVVLKANAGQLDNEIHKWALEWTEEWKNDRPRIDLTPEMEEAVKSQNELISSLVPFYCFNVYPDPVVLLDSRTGKIQKDVAVDNYFDMLGTNAKALALDKQVQKVFLIFNPYETRQMYSAPTESGGVDVLHLNMYVPPAWRELEVAPAYKGFIRKLMEHLFPIPEDREYVLDWLHYCLVSRNHTLLCLIGSQGTGKGLLVSEIVRHLHGDDYYAGGKQETLEEKFNNEFDNRRIVFFDEVDIRGDAELNRIKALANSVITVEAKGVDSKTIKNHSSMVVASNSRMNFRVEPQERRFSVPAVTDKNLTTSVPVEEINAFVERIADPRSVEIAEFGHFLLNRVPKHNNIQPYKTEYFFDLCLLSMPEWKTTIINYAIEKMVPGIPVPISDIKLAMKAASGKASLDTWPKKPKLSEFLLEYKHKGKHRVAYAVTAYDKNSREVPGLAICEEFYEEFGRCQKEDGTTNTSSKYVEEVKEVENDPSDDLSPLDIL